MSADDIAMIGESSLSPATITAPPLILTAKKDASFVRQNFRTDSTDEPRRAPNLPLEAAHARAARPASVFETGLACAANASASNAKKMALLFIEQYPPYKFPR